MCIYFSVALLTDADFRTETRFLERKYGVYLLQKDTFYYFSNFESS
jgi:hypothetical protein